MQRVVVVTGASQGIGFSVARRFLLAGDLVVAVARAGEKLRSASDVLAAEGLQCILAETDLADPHAITGAVARAAEHGPIEVLVNNAAAHTIAPVEKVALDRWETTVRTNLTAPFLLAQAVLPHLLSRGTGSIINVASVGGIFGPPQAAPYGATKAALINFTKTLAAELGSTSVRVNVVSPGMTSTEMGRSVVRDFEQTLGLSEEEIIERLQGRWIDPSEIAEVIFWLASPDASGVSGAHIVADLGQTTRLV